jgi:nucleoside-diphosphate-sugar epimerase
MFRGVRLGLAFSPGWGRAFPVSVVHADDVARAVLYACRPEARGAYHLNDGQIHTMDEFYHTMGVAVDRALGRKPHRVHVIRMPLPALTLTATLSTAFGFAVSAMCRRLTGHGLHHAPQWNLDKCREARQPGWLCDGSRIRRELGFEPQINLEAGMLEAARGYVSERLL